MYEHKSVAHIRRELLLVFHKLVKNLLSGDFRLVIEIFECGIFDFKSVIDLFFQ